MSPTQVGNFILSADVVRTAVANAGEVLILLPERGAMPIFWAADGYADEEHTMAGNGIIQLPIGSYDFEGPDHDIKKGTLRNQHKHAIVARHSTTLKEADRLLIIDEVQKGGTITELVDIVERHRGDEQKTRLYVVAAQDSRQGVSSQDKKPEYKILASGERKGAIATVVPMPLVGTDREDLLNRLWYSGNTRVPTENDPEIVIRPNYEAELIFRLLGMAVRNREALEDTSLLDDSVFSLPLGEKSSVRIEEWRHALIARLKTKVT
jgi:hypothetical protein